MSRLASGSSSSSSLGRLTSAWAISTRCCSPPERLPTRASAKLDASTASSISSTSARRRAERKRHAEPVPVEAEPDDVAGPQRHVGVEQHLLGDVADQRLRRACGAPADQHLARAAGLEAEHDPHQRRLPGAVGADQAGELARPDRERDVVEDLASRRADTLIALEGQDSAVAAGVRRVPARHSFVVESVVRDALLERLHLGEHPGLVVVAGGRHRLVDADDRDAVLALASARNDSVTESVTCWL